jgi:hypothetical protein
MNSVRHFGFKAASAEMFAAAAIELCSRLWGELDRLSAMLETGDAHALRSCFATRLETLRLELSIVLDRCAGRWTVQLNHLQREWLETIVREVLDSLDVSADELPGCQSIARAQNHLLRAVYEQLPLPEPRFAHGRSP